jgi:protocatechuate 3,4-dioxygenase beta subunit
MNRRTLLQSAGLAGIAALVPFRSSVASQAAIAKLKQEALLPAGSCILIPQETAGPYPWPADGTTLSTDQNFYRQDITEGGAGVPLNLTFNIVNINDNCNPIMNANIVIWHCDKDGNYSEFGNSVGKTFFRGIQMTDAYGQVKFKTVYPGWYSGRTTHIHFQVFLNSVVSATSQMAFPENDNTDVYNSPLYSARGQKDTSNVSDQVFSDTSNTQYEIPTITGNTTEGYQASLTIGIAAPTSGVINLSPETGGQFKLSQNYPNPFESMTTIPFTLTNPSHVLIEIFDVNGIRIVELVNQRMSEGQQSVAVNKIMNGVKFTTGAYIYQLIVENSNGVFRQCKMLTVN